MGDELEASSSKIQDLQERIDRRSSGEQAGICASTLSDTILCTGTPQKPRQRAQMLNGFASSMSLVSSSSPHPSPHRSPRPGGSMNRVPSTSTTASSATGHRRARSRSAGEDGFAEQGARPTPTSAQGYTHGMSWLPGRSERALSTVSGPVDGGAGDPESGAEDAVIDVQQAAREVEAYSVRLTGCGEGGRIRRGQERLAFEALEGLARVLKRSHRIRYQTDVQRILDQWVVPCNHLEGAEG